MTGAALDLFSPAAAVNPLTTTTPRAPQGAPDSPRVFTLTVEGEAVPKLQGSIVKFGNHASIKKHPRTKAYEDIVRLRATQVWNGRPLIRDVPIELTIRFYREIAQSWPKKRQAAAAMGDLRPTGRPDCTNLVKAFEDGLNGVVFADDALIVTSHIEKWYSERPRVELELRWVDRMQG